MSRTTSVVIPCYNAEKYLPEALESVRVQTSPALEIIIVDDGSERPVKAPDGWDGPPLVIVRTPNRGHVAARNVGFARAEGEFVALLDADDTWLPTKLEEQERALRLNPTAIGCYTQCLRGPGLFGFGPYPPMDVSDDEFLLVLWYNLFFPPSAFMFRRNAIERVGYMNEELGLGEDIEYYLRLMSVGRIIQVPHPLCRYRVHVGQMTSNLCQKMIWSKGARAHMISQQADRLVQAGLPRHKLWDAYRNDIMMTFYRRQFQAARPLLWDYWRDHPSDWAVLLRAVVSLLPPQLVRYLRDRRGSIGDRNRTYDHPASSDPAPEPNWAQAFNRISTIIGR
jgi:glycosyltransferase involved in cell wall biosynthesis